MTIKKIVNKNGLDEFLILGIESWDDFEVLATFIEEYFSCNIIDKLDGICSRTWTFQMDNHIFKLKHHDDVGNYFYTEEQDQKFIEDIAETLTKKLK